VDRLDHSLAWLRRLQTAPRAGGLRREAPVDGGVMGSPSVAALEVSGGTMCRRFNKRSEAGRYLGAGWGEGVRFRPTTSRIGGFGYCVWVLGSSPFGQLRSFGDFRYRVSGLIFA
jgi:hypothetical protein